MFISQLIIRTDKHLKNGPTVELYAHEETFFQPQP